MPGARRIGAAQAALISTAEPILIDRAWRAILVPGGPGADPARRWRADPHRRGGRPDRAATARSARAGVTRARGRRVEGFDAAVGRPRPGGSGPAAASTARAPSLMNAPSEPRPMNRKPRSRWRGSDDASRSRIPAALPAASAAVATRVEGVEIARIVEAGRGRRGCATGRSGRRTGRRRRRWRRSRRRARPRSATRSG